MDNGQEQVGLNVTNVHVLRTFSNLKQYIIRKNRHKADNTDE